MAPTAMSLTFLLAAIALALAGAPLWAVAILCGLAGFIEGFLFLDSGRSDRPPG